MLNFMIVQMMKNVQQQKIRSTIELMCKCNHEKGEFMKQNIPIQEQIIQKIEQATNFTINMMSKLQMILKQQKESVGMQTSMFQKSCLHVVVEQPKQNNKSHINQQSISNDWNKNIVRVIQAMTIAHIGRQNSLKSYYKLIDNSHQNIISQSMKYKGDIKNVVKDINVFLTDMDQFGKQQNKLLLKLVRQSKQIDEKQSAYYLVEIKKIQNIINKEIQCFIHRNKKIYQFLELILKNEKYFHGRLKQILINLGNKKKQIWKITGDDQKIFGVLSILQQNIQQSKQSYFQKHIISQIAEQRILWLLKPQKSKLALAVKYLSIQIKQLIAKYDFFSAIEELGIKISFQFFTDVSLAQGWIITTYTPCVLYLTFDHYLVVFDLKGSLLQKIRSSSTVVKKPEQGKGEARVVYLCETKKGFFSDSKQEYKIKFQNCDRMDQFILFIQNQIT